MILMISTELTDTLIVAKLTGRIDVNVDTELTGELRNLIAENTDKNFIVDLTHVEYISSSGLGIFVRIKKELATNDRLLKVTGMQAAVEKIFKISGMAEHFYIEADVETAKKTM